MAVEKMEMLNIIGHMDDVDNVARKIVLSSSVHMVSAITEIHQSNFPILNVQDNVDAVIDFNYIRQYTSQKNLNEVQNKLDALMNIFELKKYIYSSSFKEDYDFKDDIQKINTLYEAVREKHERLVELDNENRNLEELELYLSYMKHINTDLKEMLKMQYIKAKFGRLAKYNMDKLKKNYENVSAIVFKLYEDVQNVVVLIFVPQPVEIEVNRVLSSLDFEEYQVTGGFEGTPVEWLESLRMRKIQIKKEAEYIKSMLLDLKHKHENEVEKYYSRLMMEYKVEELKLNIACTNEFFYLTGWVPNYKKKTLAKHLDSLEQRLIIIYKEVKEARDSLKPPTCLKNNYILRPFESIVKLYGIPDYNEIDPTAFVGLSYMLLFGAMFGDAGQGLVLFLVGEFLSMKQHRPNLGGVIARLGLSSTIFGLLYGSFFGFENVIPALLIRPMERINNMLIAAVVFGVVLLVIGFIYNLINSFKTRDIENGIFSRNGAAGLIFYMLLLYFIISKVLRMKTFIPSGAITLTLVFLLAVMLLKEPLTNLVKGVRPLYHESKSDYYIEGGFGVIETLLSLFSNTVSFIRVGAFAINHVGLFIAFETLSEMMQNKVESSLMLILGNVVIIGLEGLIVFIQGLRLEYYELFSKYFVGAGYEYNPFIIHTFHYKKSTAKKFDKKFKFKYFLNQN